MKKIIVPTDFSRVSMEGLFFAINIAPMIEAKVELIHVYSGTISPGQPIIVQTANTYHDAALKQMNEFISEALENDSIASKNVEISGKAVVGFPEIELIQESIDPETELIIMSTTGSHGISGKIFGTVSTLLARKAKCPVLLIPKEVTYSPVDNIMFASAFLKLNKTLVGNIKKYAKIFNAKIHCVHVQEPEEDLTKVKSSMKKLESYCKENNSLEFTIQTLSSSSGVNQTLQNYIEQNEIDLTVMVAPKRSFFDAVFHRSATKEMAFSSNVPLLVFH